MRFYSVSYQEVSSMPAYAFSSMFQQMDRITAIEKLNQYEVAGSPHFKKDTRKQLLDQMKMKAQGIEPKELDNEDLAKALGLA